MIYPKFNLPAGYTARHMSLTLAPVTNPTRRERWAFYGHQDGYAVPARWSAGDKWPAHPTRRAALAWLADGSPGLIAAVWNGRRRAYDGMDRATRFEAAPRG